MIENINLDKATVSAELHGYMYNNIYGYNGVFNYGSKLSYEIISNNEIKIKDGLLCNCGRFMRILGYESISIENGTSGVTRTDLIVAHFETDGINETHVLRVIKGASGGAVPAYTQGNIYDDDTVNELPLYEVHLDGLNVVSLKQLFIPLYSFDELRNNISNPNLLINGDFRNPINQRGLTSYSGGNSNSAIDGKYTIDRWIKRNYGTTINVGDDYVRFQCDSEPSTGGTLTYALLQSIEFPELMLGKTYTLSAKIKDCKGSHMLGIWQGSGAHYTSASITGDVSCIEIIEPGEYSFTFKVDDTFSGSYDKINVGFTQSEGQHNIGDYIDIEWVKLEEGSIATPFVPKLYVEELLLCKRYYNTLNSEYCLNGYISASAKNIYLEYPSGVPMRVAPTLNLAKINVRCVNGYSILTPTSSDYIVPTNAVSTINSAINTLCNIYRLTLYFSSALCSVNNSVANATFGETLTLDAEIY